jgi:ribose transport system permease protein
MSRATIEQPVALNVSSEGEASRPRSALERSQVSLSVVAPWVILAALFAIYAALEPNVLALDQIGTIAVGALVLVLAAYGQTIVVLTSGIDLSVGGAISLSTALAATQMKHGGVLEWTLIIFIVGTFAGVINGVVVTVARMQPFIVTLATWSILDGIALLVLPTQGGSVPVSFSEFIDGSTAGVPTSIVLLVALALVWLWLKRTRILRRVYAVGSDEESAFLSGVPIGRTKIVAYAISGLTGSAAGLVYAMQTSSGDPHAGDPFILTSVAAVVIGGTSLVGGRGGVSGTIAGALILTVIADVVFAIGLPQFWTPLLQGALMIAAVVVGALALARQRRREGELR